MEDEVVHCWWEDGAWIGGWGCMGLVHLVFGSGGVARLIGAD